MSLVADISWRERYVSHALNRKFAGVIPTGIYQGFDCTADASGNVTVGIAGAYNTAVAEVGGYSVTIRMDEPEVVKASGSEPYVVLSHYYAVGAPTRVSVKAVSAPESGQIVLCHFDSASTDNVDYGPRDVARLVQMDTTLVQMAEAQVTQMHRYLTLKFETEAELEAVREAAREQAEEVARKDRNNEAATAQLAAASVDAMTREIGVLDRVRALEGA